MSSNWSPPGHERVPDPASPYSSYAPNPYPDYGAAPTPGQSTVPLSYAGAATAGPVAPQAGTEGASSQGPAGPPPTAPSDPFALPPHLAHQALAGPGYQSPRMRNSPWAVVTMVLALVLFFVPWASLAVIALGHLTLHLLKDSYDGGRGLALGGLALGYLSVAGWSAIYLA